MSAPVDELLEELPAEPPSPEELPVEEPAMEDEPGEVRIRKGPETPEPPATGIPPQETVPSAPPPAAPSLAPFPDSGTEYYECEPEEELSSSIKSKLKRFLPTSNPGPVAMTVPDYSNPREPLMSYTRMFDGTDSDLQASLRDYVELNVDRRSGGWEAYLQRSDDFIRFTAHRMIVEMLILHGGEGKRRIIFTHRKFN
jgi:hypothetical protein